MAAPFLALTMPLPGFDPQPIFINALHVREVRPRWLRKQGVNGKGPEAHDLAGSWITTGSGEDGTFPVCEEYAEITGAIREALADTPLAPVQQDRPCTAAPSSSTGNSELEPDDRQSERDRGLDRQGRDSREIGGRAAVLSGGVQRGERDVRGEGGDHPRLTCEAGVSEALALANGSPQ